LALLSPSFEFGTWTTEHPMNKAAIEYCREHDFKHSSAVIFVLCWE
jgi:hypothetical protein